MALEVGGWGDFRVPFEWRMALEVGGWGDFRVPFEWRTACSVKMLPTKLYPGPKSATQRIVFLEIHICQQSDEWSILICIPTLCSCGIFLVTFLNLVLIPGNIPFKVILK